MAATAQTPAQVRGIAGRAAGRPLGFDPAAALDRAAEAFWLHGYDATTTTVLEQATALSRSSLLNTFGPKEQLLLAAVDRYQDGVDATLIDPLLSGSQGLQDAVVFFTRLGELKAHRPGSHGCLIVNLSAERSDPPAAVRERVERYRARLAAGFTAALERAARRGEIDPATLTGRVEVLVALAVAVNWTARASGPTAAQRLARSARRTITDWRRSDTRTR